MAQSEASGQRLCIVRFEAVPPLGGWPEGPNVAGAFVVCYVKSDSFFNAIRLAAETIKDQGWRIDEPEYAELECVHSLLDDDETNLYARGS